MDHGRPLIEWAAAGRPRSGEFESGDAHVVVESAGAALIAVVDGLGHGSEAAQAARTALAAVESSPESPLSHIAAHCHQTLRETRGAVMTLARIDATAGTLTWLGIGNVAGVVVRGAHPARDVLVSRVGLVGDHMPNVGPATLPFAIGDTLILATDGVDWSPFDRPVLDDHPGVVARELLDACGVASDDALVLVARLR